MGKCGLRVLVVDDNEDATGAAARYLEIVGHAPRAVASAAQALEAAAETPPDVVVLDLGLPDADGLDLLARLRETVAPRALACIAVTGRSDDATRRRARAAGVDEFLVKPVALEVLSAAVAAAGVDAGRRLAGDG